MKIKIIGININLRTRMPCEGAAAKLGAWNAGGKTGGGTIPYSPGATGPEGKQP